MSIFLFFILAVAIATPKKPDLKNIQDYGFSATLYKELGKDCHNFVISPLLVETAFAALYLGSSGKTAEEIRTVFHLPPKTGIEHKYKTLIPQLTNPGYTLNIANRVSLAQKYKFVPTWETQIKNIFEVCADLLDMTNKNAAAEKVNKWFRDKTNNKIDKMVSADALTSETALLLLSSLYFQGNWDQQFSVSSTRKQTFYNHGKQQVSVDMMFASARSVNYGKSDLLNAQFLEIAFEKHHASMVVVLPDQLDGIYQLETKINEIFNFRDFCPETVNIWLPKFRMDSTFNIDKILQQLGVKDAFDETKAQFSGTVSCADCHSPYIGKVTQKTYLQINERGVEAAAGQVVHVRVPLSGGRKQFKADHPFLFYIKIKEVVVFIGRVSAF
nr:PREDICTED: leukocyte elastase inhibitor isoform X1 [Tribolium castaneum]|eukprot:XP_015838238.1 PREDICTED: leukocyte elastase inhibitor isoform X1 [Tribolium castaneum]